MEENRFYSKSQLAERLNLTWRTLKTRLADFEDDLNEIGPYTRANLLSPAHCAFIMDVVNGKKTKIKNNTGNTGKPEL